MQRTEVAPRVAVACLSNSNALHWNHQRDAPVLDALFPKRFLSHELDMIKPDREVYEHMLEDLGCSPAAVCFLDDNRLNVDAALELGIDAQRVAGTEEAREALHARGLLP
ncbi:MAG: HAD-IA family hydrolase [Myxococcales bacterium]|nr:HAD-IA family hydrolase [Myxococcales bacterium]